MQMLFQTNGGDLRRVANAVNFGKRAMPSRDPVNRSTPKILSCQDDLGRIRRHDPFLLQLTVPDPCAGATKNPVPAKNARRGTIATATSPIMSVSALHNIYTSPGN